MKLALFPIAFLFLLGQSLAQTAVRTVMTDQQWRLTGGSVALFSANSNRLHSVIGVTNIPAYIEARGKLSVTNLSELLSTPTIYTVREAFVKFDTGFDGASGDWFFDPTATATTNAICRKPNDTSVGRWIKK